MKNETPADLTPQLAHSEITVTFSLDHHGDSSSSARADLSLDGLETAIGRARNSFLASAAELRRDDLKDDAPCLMLKLQVFILDDDIIGESYEVSSTELPESHVPVAELLVAMIAATKARFLQGLKRLEIDFD